MTTIKKLALTTGVLIVASTLGSAEPKTKNILSLSAAILLCVERRQMDGAVLWGSSCFGKRKLVLMLNKCTLVENYICRPEVRRLRS